ENHFRSHSGSWGLWLCKGIPRGALDAGCQDYPDIRRDLRESAAGECQRGAKIIYLPASFEGRSLAITLLTTYFLSFYSLSVFLFRADPLLQQSLRTAFTVGP